MVNDLDKLYIKMLRNGLVSIRNALCDKNYEWASAQSEFLHEVPSLIGESNISRHRYFWNGTRALFIEWVNENCTPGNEYKEEMYSLYKTSWREMEEIIENL